MQKIRLNTAEVPPPPKVYLERTDFNPPGDGFSYEVSVREGGLTVYSECCADTMSRETMIATRDAINAWVADNPE